MRKWGLALILLLAAHAWAVGPFEFKRPPSKSQALPFRAKFDSTHEYDVKKYTLSVYLTMYNDSMYGQQRISALKNQAVDSIDLNSVRLDIDSVRVNGVPAGFSISSDTTVLRIDVSPVATSQYFLMDIYYRGGMFGENGDHSRGYYWYPQGYAPGTMHNLGYTMSEPQDARMWMPCFDEPWDKADSGCQIRVSLPDTFKVAANGLLTDTVRSGDTLTWTWTENSTIATYLMCITASRYSSWSDYAHLDTGDSVPISYFVWPEDSSLAASYFSVTPNMVECYSRMFHAYPFSKYGMAAIYPFDWGGMEHQTMTTIHRVWIYGNFPEGIAHELSHMWFGDLVTCGTWADIWLNEGFASYSEALFYEADINYPPGDYVSWYFSDALGGEALNHPIYDPPSELLFDWSMVYCKGAWVAHGLRWVMGDSLYFQTLRDYCDSFAYGNAVTEDLRRLAEQHYGSDLGWFFDEWVHRAGHPVYATVTYYNTKGDSNTAKVKLLQSSTTGDIYKMPVMLSCSTQYGVKDTVVWDSVAATGYIGLADTMPIYQILFDRKNWILKEYSDSLPNLITLEPAAKNKGGPVRVCWNRFTTDTQCAGYNLYRFDIANGILDRVNQTVLIDTALADSGVVPGQEYYYYVTAVCGEDTCYETRNSNILFCTAGVEGEPSDHDLGTTVCRLLKNKPNPFNRDTEIRYQLTRSGKANLKVYNLAGQLVRELLNGTRPAGEHSVRWDGRDADGNKVPSGIYFTRLEAEGKVFTRTLHYIK